MKYTAEQTNQFFEDRLEVLGITQAELATRAGITPADVSRYKAGKQKPAIDNIERLADALGTDVITLMIGLGAADPEGKFVPRVIQERTKDSPAIYTMRKLAV